MAVIFKAIFPSYFQTEFFISKSKYFSPFIFEQNFWRVISEIITLKYLQMFALLPQSPNSYLLHSEIRW